MAKLSGKIALITGSDSGMGQAMACAFAREGAAVAVTYHSDSEGAQRTLEIIERTGGRGLIRQLDVSDPQSVAALFQSIDEELGRPDILVNNAGIGGGGALTEISPEALDKVLKTDLYGPFYCAQEFVRRRQNADGDKILNITSVHDSIPSPGHSPYGAAKGGLLALTRSLALELAPRRINVNAIAPGLIHTPMTAQRLDDPNLRQQELPHIPWRRAGKPEEVAELALYLVGPDADYVTGQSFVIDGGLEMNWGQGA